MANYTLSLISSNTFQGSLALLCEPAMSQLSSSKVTASEVICLQCRKPTDDICSHMGQHILRSIRGIDESLVSTIDFLSPCGFCGQSQASNPKCTLKVKVTSHTTEFLTECPCQVPIKVGLADKGSQK